MEFVVQTKDLCKTFADKNVVNHVNINIRKGDIYGLIGENGAGKTTFMRMLWDLPNPRKAVCGFSRVTTWKNNAKKLGVPLKTPPSIQP
jgi:ABC-type multidrug transport system ATPase subunit